MKKLEETKDQQLLEKLIRGGRTNLSERFEKNRQRILRGTSSQGKYFGGNHQEEILHRPHRAILMFLTDLAVQIPDRERSGTYR